MALSLFVCGVGTGITFEKLAASAGLKKIFINFEGRYKGSLQISIYQAA